MKTAKGINGNVEITDTGVKITRGRKGFFLGGLTMRGDKNFPFKSISAIQFKNPGLLTSGYIQFTISGGGEAKSGLFQATSDENSVVFTKQQAGDFIEIKELIEKQMHSTGDNHKTSNLDEIEKLAILKQKGLITSTEFEQKKKQLLGL